MGNRTLILARHGDYTLTIEFPQNPDGSLNEKGKQQSSYLAERLQKMKLDAIYTSPLLRANETTQIVSERCLGVPVHVDDLLQEAIPSVPKGLEHLFAEIPQSFIDSGPAQAAQVFDTYFTTPTEDEPDYTAVIVSHGNMLGYLIARVMESPFDMWLRPAMGNCCISEIRIMPSGRMKLMRHNDGEHLPVELRSE